MRRQQKTADFADDATGGSAIASGRPRSSAAATHPARARRSRRSDRTRGQAVVEFSLVLPLFLTVMLAIIEFGFAFNSVLAVNFASRNAALTAAESGDAEGTDCLVLRTVERDVTAPADRGKINEVDIFRADKNGAMVGTATIYARNGGSTTCNYAGGLTVTVPYSLVQDGYAEEDRCNTLSGCEDGRTLDQVGVRITYTHTWVTPLRNFIGGNPGGFSFDRSNATRMEPVL
jgi:Flp pilus assembly protein TadG